MKKILLSLVLLSSSFAFGAALEEEADAIPDLVALLGLDDIRTKRRAAGALWSLATNNQENQK